VARLSCARGGRRYARLGGGRSGARCLLLMNALFFLLRELEVIRSVVGIRIQMKGLLERLDRFGILLVVVEQHSLIEELPGQGDPLLLGYVKAAKLRELGHQSEDVG